jgi:UDP:flavonoid glycosyltransferase YjiC (YdhE family)
LSNPESFSQSSNSQYNIMVRPHFLLVTYPIQGHINPGLQFAKRLIRLGAHVTFVTTVAASRRMAKTPDLDGLSFSIYSDGYDDGFKDGDDISNYMSEIKRRGSQALTDLVVSSANEGRPFTGLVYTIFLPWAADVASEFHLPSALLWIQPAMVLTSTTTTSSMAMVMSSGTAAMTRHPRYNYRDCHCSLAVTCRPSCLLQIRILLCSQHFKSNLKRLKKKASREF